MVEQIYIGPAAEKAQGRYWGAQKLRRSSELRLYEYTSICVLGDNLKCARECHVGQGPFTLYIYVAQYTLLTEQIYWRL